MNHAGDFAAGSSVVLLFNTNAKDGSSVAPSSFGSVRVYKDGGATEDTSAVTTDDNFDSITGVHKVTIDTTADASFYTPGSDFHVVLVGATVDGETVNAVIGSFSLENRRTEVLLHAQCSTADSAFSWDLSGSDLSATDDFYNGSLIVATSGTNRGIVRQITDYVGATKTVTIGGTFPVAPSVDDRFQILGLK